jgi:hypothetical protein
MTVEEARRVVAPWYALFNIATRGDVAGTRVAVRGEVSATPPGNSLIFPTLAAVFASWPSVFKYLEAGKFPKPFTWRTG